MTHYTSNCLRGDRGEYRLVQRVYLPVTAQGNKMIMTLYYGAEHMCHLLQGCGAGLSETLSSG